VIDVQSLAYFGQNRVSRIKEKFITLSARGSQEMVQSGGLNSAFVEGIRVYADGTSDGGNYVVH